MEEIILLGAGGHCKAVIDVIEQENKYKILGLLDNLKNIGDKISGYSVLGNDELIDHFINLNKKFVITVGHVKSSNIRRKLSKKLPLALCPNIISPLSYISSHASIGMGNVFMHNSIINIDAKIGNHNIFN
ncbi:MAG: acetyltransferase, partial [Flavobacterium sp.]